MASIGTRRLSSKHALLRCPSCRHRPLSAAAAVALPNTRRERIICRKCGELLVRRPMQSLPEAIVVWAAIMAPGAPLVLIGGSLGFGLALLLTLLLLWIAPWQGLSYALPAGIDRDQLPVARSMAALPPGPKVTPTAGGERPSAGN
jgi:hypothetical protein